MAVNHWVGGSSPSRGVFHNNEKIRPSLQYIPPFKNTHFVFAGILTFSYSVLFHLTPSEYLHYTSAPFSNITKKKSPQTEALTVRALNYLQTFALAIKSVKNDCSFEYPTILQLGETSCPFASKRITAGTPLTED